MKTVLTIMAVLVFLGVTANPCLALWAGEIVSKERAKALGMGVGASAAGPSHVHVELSFKAEGELKNFSSVELRLGEGDSPTLTALLQEDRSRPGRIVVSFNADRAQLGKIKLWVRVPDGAGGTIYDLRVNDFLELEKGR